MSFPHGFIDTRAASALLEAAENDTDSLLEVAVCMTNGAKMPKGASVTNETIGYALSLSKASDALELLEGADIEAATVPKRSKPEDMRALSDKTAAYTEGVQHPLRIQTPRVDKEQGSNGSYYSIAEVRLDQLRKVVPEADGRGMVVGLVDDGLDILHPAVALGLTAEGKPAPKLFDLDLAGILPSAPASVATQEVTVKNGIFECHGVGWRAPQDGSFRFGLFRETLFVTGIVLEAAVLWDVGSGKVWVDTDHLHDFTKAEPLTDYGVRQEFGWFGAKDEEGDNRIPFMLKLDAANQRLFLRVPGNHGVWVTGAMGGNRLEGGLYDGAAPGVRVVDVGGWWKHSYIRAFAHPQTSVINRSGGVGRSMDGGLENFDQIVLSRAIETFDKPFVIYGDIPGSIYVLDYSSAAELKFNRQIQGPYLESMNAGVGLSENGLVNVVLGPSTQLLARSRYDAIEKSSKKPEWRVEPPAPEGYGIGANPSCTIGASSGIVACVLSAAKSRNIRTDVHRINNAIFTSCRQIEGFPASKQGHGLINAMGAFEQLRAMAEADGDAKTLTRFTLEIEREGVRKPKFGYAQEFKDAIAYEKITLWITRVGGPQASQKYRLGFKADVAAFSLEQWDIEFPLNVAVPVILHVHVRPGHHLSFLRLVHGDSGTVMQDIALQLRAPEIPITIAPGETLYRQILPPRRNAHLYVQPQTSCQATRMQMRIPFAGSSSIRNMPGVREEARTLPEGIVLDPVTYVGSSQNFEALRPYNGELVSVFWENSGRPEYLGPADVHAPMVAIQGELIVKSYAVGWQRRGEGVEVHNRLAPLEGSVLFHNAEETLHSKLQTKGPRHRSSLEFTVAADLAALRLNFDISHGAELLDAFLLLKDDSGMWRVRHRQEIQPGAIVHILKPAAGEWKLVTFARAYDPSKELLAVGVNIVQLSLIEETSTFIMAHDERRIVSYPQGSKPYFVAFRIAGAPGNERQKDGVLVAWEGLGV